MRTLATIFAACVLVTAPALAQSLGEKTGVNSAMGLTPTTGDFVTEAASSDMFEIQSSKLADQRAEGKTKIFANRMIEDHTKTSNELKSMVQDGKVDASLPTKMASAQQRMLDQLQQLHDATSFTTEYQKDQVNAHKDAISLFQRYADGGSNATLKMWAVKTLPVLQEHLRMAENLAE